MKKIAERLHELIEKGTQSIATRRFQWLANHSTVSAEAWRSFWNGKQRPSAEMIEAAAHTWPDYAFWLATGISDPRRGHNRPRDNNLQADSTGLRRRTASRDLFIAEIAYGKWREENGWTDEEDKNYHDRFLALLDTDSPMPPDPRASESAGLQHHIWELSVIRDDQEQTLRKLEIDDGNREWPFEEPGSPDDVIVRREHAGSPAERTITNVPVHLKYKDDENVSHPRYFDWGYKGRAPNIFAANILFHFGVSAHNAVALRDKFETEVISTLHKKADRLSAVRIREWIEENQEKNTYMLIHGPKNVIENRVATIADSNQDAQEK